MDFDLYEGFHDENIVKESAKEHELNEELKKQKASINSLNLYCAELKAKLEKSLENEAKLKQENSILQRNITVLFETAQLEMKRKADQIRMMQKGN